MAFKMVCPKCGSLNYSVERDGRSYIRTGPSSELIFSCRCGKQLFGDALTEEFERQRSAYESQAADRQRAERDREAAVIAEREKDEKLRQAMEFQRNYQREKREQEAESARAAKEEADAAWRAKVSAPGGGTDGEDSGGELLPPGTPPDPDPETAPAPSPRAASASANRFSMRFFEGFRRFEDDAASARRRDARASAATRSSCRFAALANVAAHTAAFEGSKPCAA